MLFCLHILQSDQEEREVNVKKKERLGRVGLFLLAVTFVAVGGTLLLQQKEETKEGWIRQEIEEDLADAYLKDLRQQVKKKQDHLEPFETETTDEDFEDTQYYTRDGVTYTPDYAWGTLECVLEIPKIQLRRGVYEGAIEHDLDLWMTTAALDAYELGKTHYCIYGHNHTEQNLSFNRLRDLVEGDRFTLTNQDGIWEYRVTKVFAVSREEARDQYVNNFELSSDLCYLITCGRDEYRYLDLMVEGTLQTVRPIEDQEGR